jgi:signal transduction histidine kinase/response regulator RpfG family c-di-GMP phosphodiesterase
MKNIEFTKKYCNLKDVGLMKNGTQKINILLVDDNPHNLLALETILYAPDRNLVRASSGEEALRYLLDEDAAVILLDVHMPIIDGIETAALIRGRERTRNVPIIFLTAHDTTENTYISQGYSLGAVDYIIKPIDPEALKSKVAVFVELYRKNEQVKRQAELLRQKNIELEKANIQRLSRLIELSQKLAAERDPELLLEKLCSAALDILGARYATVGMLEEDGQRLSHFFTCGLDVKNEIDTELAKASQNLLEEHFKSKRSLRLSRSDIGWISLLKFGKHMPIDSFLGATIHQHGKVQGWLYLADKHNAREFSEADEHFAATLTQTVVFYENARLYVDLQHHAIALEQEIAERKQAEKERAELLLREQAARREAETANRLKDEFLATVSHELRTPLNAILGWVTLIQNGRLPDEDRAKALDTIERNARSQKKLIDDLLDVSRIITGKLRLDIQPIELVSIIESAVESVRPAAEAKGMILQTESELVICPFQGDANRIQQVIWNLLTNAVKFTPPGGMVLVKLKRVDGHIEIAVSDTGVGIAVEFLPYVFDRFRQADGSITKRHGGLGLGLAIVRHLVEMHGGTVDILSDGQGKGTTFTVRLPISLSSALINQMNLATSANQAITVSPNAPKLTGLRVLVVDDQSDTRELLTAILYFSEAEVKTARNIEEAMECFFAWQPEIVISDIAMPDGDGYELIRRLKKHERSSGVKVPTIALTAHAGTEDRIRALAAGFQLYLSKPVEPDELVVSVASLLGKLTWTKGLSE